MKAGATNPLKTRWQSMQLLRWAVSFFCWSALAAAASFVLALVILGVAEIGLYGAILLAVASAVVVGTCLRWVAPFVKSNAARVKWRFSLRTLLLTTAIGGVMLAWIGNRMRDVYHQRQITKRLSAGGFFFGFKRVSRPDAMPRWVYRYFGMNGAIAYGGLDKVVNVTSVSAKDLEALGGLRYRYLCLNFSSVTDGDLLHLKPDKNLRKFEAQSIGLRDNALAHLGQFDGLESIDVRKSSVSDAGIAHLVRLKRLKVLVLTDTAVTDASVPHLKAMSQLRFLFLNGTAMTPQAAAELQRALPNCTVDLTSSSGAAYAPDDY